MEQIKFEYSLKDIPVTDDKIYVQKVISKWELTDKAMKWKVCRAFGKKTNKSGRKEKYGFPTCAPAPIPKADCPGAKPLKEFQKGMVDLIRDIEFNKQTNTHQDKLKEDIAKIKSEKRVYVPADKTSNMYLVQPARYKELLDKSVHKEYKKSSENTAILAEKADLKIAAKLEINDRIHRTSKRDSFVTLKDHKPGFHSNPSCRLLNPTKPELGKVSKQMLEKLNSELRAKKTELKQWRQTKETRNWFNNLESKHTLTFLKFDVEAFYPSISEELLSEAFEWASTLLPVTEEVKEVVNATKKALLYVQGKPWTKKGEREFDVSMGSYDGAEVCEMVGLFILSLLQPTGVDLGLYRDDLLGVTSLKGRPLEMMKQKIISIFQEKGLKVVGTVNLRATDFLDIFLDLQSGTHRPFAKEGDRPSYVHCQSNHPPSVLKNIGLGINKRLSMLSSNEGLFDQASPMYQDALIRSKHEHRLEFSEEEPTRDGQSKSRRRRKRDVIYWNPPFSMNVKTNVGGKFLALIDKCFPKDGPLGKIFNRNTLKISYSTCPNMKQTISAHNKKVLAESLPKEKKKTCSCSKATQKAGTCPLQGFCLDKNLVYQATVVETKLDGEKKEETYVGCTGTDWKSRLGNHNKSFRHERYKHETVLSTHIWEIKSRGSTYTLAWKILDRGAPFDPATRSCMLCCKEKFFIIRKPGLASLNSRQEVGSHCLHMASSLISTVAKVKV